jgi:Fe-S oxidoreductase
MSAPPREFRSPAEVDRFLDEHHGLPVDALVPLPEPYHDWRDADLPALTEAQRSRYEVGPDGICAVRIPIPKDDEERSARVVRFLDGLRKLLSREDNWTFLQPLLLSLENCVQCHTCSDACPIFNEAGQPEIYRPSFRPEILRKLINRYLKPGGSILARWRGLDVTLDWDTLARLAELSYRCTLCRRCAQACPMAVDNGLITREIRKLFSQELGIVMPELHEHGTVKQLKTGSSTGLNPAGLRDILEFAEEDIEEKTGLSVKIPVDVEGADYLVMHNAGEFLAWPENLQAFAVVLDRAGVSWTLASDLLGYDSVNYGLFYDDVQFARIALRHHQVAKALGVKKLLMGECGHAHKASMPLSDRLVPRELHVPAESALVLLEEIVVGGRVRIDPSRNDFPVTLHDPCNITRSMGIVRPQREVLRRVAPGFREMEPHGVDNFCCGGGSGFAVNTTLNFPDWRTRVAGRIKFRQILQAFRGELSPETRKYVCAPCSNCKGQIRDLLRYYQGWERCGIHYGGLVELVVNAMTDVKPGFLEWEFK